MAKTDIQLKKSAQKKRTAWAVAIILAVLWLLVAFVPFLFMVLTGFKQKLETIMYGAFHLPETLYLQNYIDVITDVNFWIYFRNSVIVLVVSLVILLFISACAAYPLSRFRFRLRVRRGRRLRRVLRGELLPTAKLRQNVLQVKWHVLRQLDAQQKPLCVH